MRHALVVYESMFGNTQKIAEAVVNGLSSQIPTVILEVGTAPDVLADDVQLLVVGGPTHAFGMSRPRTREDATRQANGHVISARQGLREWLASLERGTGEVAVATFDTRIDKPHVPGSAARGAEKRLRRLGFLSAAPPESFYVTGTAGPLLSGETERARRWGEELGKGYVVDLSTAETAGGQLLGHRIREVSRVPHDAMEKARDSSETR